MLSTSWQQALDFAALHNTPVVIVDSQKDKAFVLSPLESKVSTATDLPDYQNLTEEEFLSKINREISLWRQAQSPAPKNEPVNEVDVDGEYQFEPIIEAAEENNLNI